MARGPRNDLTGQRFERLVAVSWLPKDEDALRPRAGWVCLCDCGQETFVPSGSLVSGNTRSCGCLHRERAATLHTLAKDRYWPRTVDRVGQRFGMLEVIELARVEDNITHWLCRCDCGTEKTVRAGNLITGSTTSCGCNRYKSGEDNPAFKHGAVGTPAYGSWEAMKDRCLHTYHKSYESYGGAGVTICDRWLDFENFLEDMGERPPGETLDRINPFGNYEPGNCRWVDPKTQAQNKRANYKGDS